MKDPIDCENCGKRAAPVVGKCGACGEEFGFLCKPRKSWKPWDYSGWLFAQHYILDEFSVERGLGALADGQRLVVVIGALFYQVLNGGLGQYYSNPTGANAVEAAAALRFIGADKLASALGAVNALFPGGAPSAVDDQREAQLDGIAERPFEKCAGQISKMLNSFTSSSWLSLLVDKVGEKPVVGEERPHDASSPPWLSPAATPQVRSAAPLKTPGRSTRAKSSSATGSAVKGSEKRLRAEAAGRWPRAQDYDAWLVATGEAAAQPRAGEDICYCHFAIQALAERQKAGAVSGLVDRLLAAAGRNQEHLFDGHEVAVSAFAMLGDDAAARTHLAAMEGIAGREKSRSDRAWLKKRTRASTVESGLGEGGRDATPEEAVAEQAVRARRALARRDVASAVRSLRAIESAARKTPVDWQLLHSEYLRAGDLDGARRALRKVPSNDRALYLIPSLCAAGLREEAIMILERQGRLILKRLANCGPNPAGAYSDAKDLVVQTLASHGREAATEVLRRVDAAARTLTADWGFSTAAAYASMSSAHAALGSASRAEALLREAYDVVAKKTSGRDVVLPTIAEEHARQGRVDEALTLVERLRSSARRVEARCHILCVGRRWEGLHTELAAIEKPARAASIGWAVCLHLAGEEERQRAQQCGS